MPNLADPSFFKALLYVIFIRIGLEFSVAMIRTAQNTTKIAEKQN